VIDEKRVAALLKAVVRLCATPRSFGPTGETVVSTPGLRRVYLATLAVMTQRTRRRK
jgi:hypothetical protein